MNVGSISVTTQGFFIHFVIGRFTLLSRATWVSVYSISLRTKSKLFSRGREGHFFYSVCDNFVLDRQRLIISFSSQSNKCAGESSHPITNIMLLKSALP